MKYYISDLHLGHYNIMRLCNRPFESTEEMDETIITNWNSVVKDNDDVYILGDFSFKSSKNPVEYLKRLKGRKHLIIGNHDGFLLKNPEAKKYFVEICEMLTIEDNGDKIVLCHYPMVEWNGCFRNVLHYYGHIHNNTTNKTFDIVRNIDNAYNVGVEILDYIPRTKDEVINQNEIFLKRF